MSASNLFDHFHERVDDAIDREGLDLADDTRLYLASLLTERARADRPAPPETTLAELHGRAALAPPGEQAATYRELGDRALYLLGYFHESLTRRIVGPDYYASMGKAAYHRTDVVLKAWFADAFGPVFHELSLQFDSCVRVIGTVRDSHTGEHPDPLVQLYERWVETGSEQARARLLRRGLILPGGEPVED
ncbi:MAG: hypothetical protein EP330_06790 [Deltaproteobacteria bacterium]|nr:MAG: hypothetical protein EP330_06790 [Deltaproteobacteria bacterium]